MQLNLQNLRVGVTGASGFAGRAVCLELERAGCTVVRFSRNPKNLPTTFAVRRFSIEEPPDCSELDAVVHLAGENINGLWTEAKKERIRGSRVQGTRELVEGIRAAGTVQTLISASAIGYYGDTGDCQLDENGTPGSGFLADVCRAWEAEALRAREFGCRVAVLRIGLVLGNGGALRMMLPAFRLGLGGRLGNGRQWMSAIHVAEIGAIVRFVLQNASAQGAYNAVMPEPFTNSEFTRTLSSVLHRPALFPVPAMFLRFALGELAHLLLASSRIVPRRLLEEGYKFRFPQLRGALEDVLKGANF